MGKVYHFHADVGAYGKLDCSTFNGHDASCAKGELTNGNEDSCSVVTVNFPLGKPHKCYHDVPDAKLKALLRKGSPIDIWVVSSKAKAKKATKAKAKKATKTKRK